MLQHRGTTEQTDMHSKQPCSTTVTVIKAAHSLIFLSMAAAILHTLYSGLTNRVSRLTIASIVAVIGESLVLITNNMRCPLTDMVEDCGSDHGSVSDIFLPKWFADRIPVLFTPPFAVGLALIGLRRANRHPVAGTISAMAAGLFVVVPWLLRMDHPRPRQRDGAQKKKLRDHAS